MTPAPVGNPRGVAHRAGRFSLWGVAAWLLASAPTFGATAADTSTAPASAAASAPVAKGKSSLLTIAVSGNHKPVVQADVKVLYGAGGTNHIRQFTNASGEATFSALPVGSAKIRVIAPGWKTVQRPVVLKKGANRTEIALAPDTVAPASAPQ